MVWSNLTFNFLDMSVEKPVWRLLLLAGNTVSDDSHAMENHGVVRHAKGRLGWVIFSCNASEL